MSEALAQYRFYNLDLKESGTQGQGDCPFCQKPEHFYVSARTGQYDCKVCGANGNIYTYLEWLISDLRKSTTKEDYDRLSHQRDGLPTKLLKEDGFVWDSRSERWLVPSRNLDGNIANVLTWTPGGPLMGGPGLAHHLEGGWQINKVGPIYVCEGRWDRLALLALFGKLKHDAATYSVVSVPGATTFKKDWLKSFQGREVYFLYDNDEAGQTGTFRAVTLLKSIAGSIQAIKWPQDVTFFPEGYDVRDFILPRLKHPGKCWAELKALLSQDATVEKPKLKRTTLASVLKDFREVIHLSPPMEDALCVMFAVMFSCRLPGDPLWLYVKAPPGGGKSLLLQAFDDPDYAVSASRITRQSLVSGMNSDGEDSSLLPQLSNKCLIVKDFTVIKTLPEQEQESLYSILRDAWDGNVKVIFGNGIVRNFKDLHFSMLAGVTPIIDGDSNSHLGERFLKIDPLFKEKDFSPYVRSARQNSSAVIRSHDKLRASVSAFLAKEIKHEDLPNFTQEEGEKIDRLAFVIARIRSHVERNGKELAFRPFSEIPTRLSAQFTRLAQFLCVTLGKKSLDQEILRLVTTVAFHTVTGWVLEIGEFLLHRPAGCTPDEVSAGASISLTTTWRVLEDMLELQMVSKEYITEGGAKTVWHLDPELREEWKKIIDNAGGKVTRPVRRQTRGPKKGAKYKKSVKTPVAKSHTPS